MKKLVFILITALLLGGCVTQKKCLVKFPPDTVTRVETNIITEYRDTIIYKHIPGDSVFVERIIPADIPPFNIEPLTARLPLSHSTAWVNNGRLHLGLWIDSTTLQFKIDSAKATVKTDTHTIETVTVEVPVPPSKWHGRLTWTLGGALFGVLGILAVMLRNR